MYLEACNTKHHLLLVPIPLGTPTPPWRGTTIGRWTPGGRGTGIGGNSRYTRVGRGVYARACTYSIRIPVPWYLYPTRYLHLPRGTYPSLSQGYRSVLGGVQGIDRVGIRV